MISANAVLLACAAVTAVTCAGNLQIVNEWTTLTYDVPFNYPNADSYKSEVTVSTGIEIGWDRIFITTPRLFNGNPATLAWVPRNRAGVNYDTHKSPLLQAYPNWEWHSEASSGDILKTPTPNCSSLVSVFRVRADRCNRLWVLDSGVMDSIETFKTICPPKLLVFDMRTDRVVRSVTLPAEILRPNTLLTNLVIDDQVEVAHLQDGFLGDCDNVFVYMTDSTNPGILVYDARRDTAWRLSHPYMFPDPDFGTFSVAGESFTLMDGIIGLALSPFGSVGRRLYFQPFASDRLFSVPTSALKAGPNLGDDADLPVSLVGHKSSQAAPLAVDPKDGALIFSPVSETALATWIPGSVEHGVLAYSPEELQFVLDIRSADRDQGAIWLVSSRLQRYFKKTLDKREVNIRIMRILREPEFLPYAFNNNNSLLLFK
ncbi:protein yellow [Acyrthosiphon pisum]|uniref:Bee-milk protein n=1 Tax=Acyrthosiphon pisum TaxID=7029 RepID=A0A8R1W1D0_ACYPI|nr:protein yellow [Acyrthosiphon pisum]|eukprot:XP_001948479.1 PREDICTED: protein yellow [Acyrthosiphon pisum]